MIAAGAHLARALEWVARLPLLGEPELARLLGVDEPDARALRLALERLGWVEWVVARDGGLAPDRLSFVREAALPALARLLPVEEDALAARVPARRGDILARIVRAGTTARVNRFLAELAANPGIPHVELEDARSLPLAMLRSERWWPRGVEGYGCLRAGSLRAPFFVAWDREGAPDAYRRQRALGWAAPTLGAEARWGAEGLPPVLLVRRGRRGRAVWERALGRAAERAARRPPGVLVADADEIAAAGPAGSIWSDPVAARAGSLLEQLGWGAPPPLGRVCVTGDLGGVGRPPPGESLRRWAPRAAAGSAAGIGERVAAIAMTTDPDEKRLLEWIGRWPLLSIPQLASLASLDAAAVERRVERILRLGIARFDTDGQPDESPAKQLLLTPLGLLLLARRDGVPEGHYALFAGVSAPDPAGDAPSVRHRAHQLGLNGVVARLAADARAAGGRLVVCRNEAQSTSRFRHEGRAAWIRPDGSGVVALGGGRVPFLLEYDRGTLDSGDFAAKFGGYARYYAARAWRRDFDAEPLLLFVCIDDRAEEHVVRAARRAARESALRLPLLATTGWRSGRGPRNPRGLLGPVWGPSGASGEGRRSVGLRVPRAESQ